MKAVALAVGVASVQAVPAEYDAYSKVPENMRAALDQGQCGSCWAFSTTEQLSARIVTYKPDSPLGSWGGIISPEIPVALFNIGGCNGASPTSAVQRMQGRGLPEIGCAQYLQWTHDCTEKDVGTAYGCVFLDANTCYSDRKREYHTWGYYPSAYVNGVQAVSGLANMQNDVSTWGPLSVMISVTQQFYNYRSGVYSFSDKVLPGKHEVLITGWGLADSSVKAADTYWRVKNSWTASWGESGFFRIWAGYNCLGIEESGTSIRLGDSAAEFDALKDYAPPVTPRVAGEVFPGEWVEVDMGVHQELIQEASEALEMNQGGRPEVTKVEAQVVAGYNMKLHASIGGRALKAVAHMPPNNDMINGPRFEIIDVRESEVVV